MILPIFTTGSYRAPNNPRRSFICKKKVQFQQSIRSHIYQGIINDELCLNLVKQRKTVTQGCETEANCKVAKLQRKAIQAKLLTYGISANDNLQEKPARKTCKKNLQG